MRARACVCVTCDTIHAVLQAARWSAAFNFAYPIEAFCSIIVKFMVLERMLAFALAKPDAPLLQRWLLIYRWIIVAVSACSLAGLLGSIAAAAYQLQLAALETDASAQFAANNTAAGAALIQQSQLKVQDSNRAQSVQLLCETAVLLLIVVTFVAAGCMSLRVINNTDTASQTSPLDPAPRLSPSALKLKRQITTTVAVGTTLNLPPHLQPSSQPQPQTPSTTHHALPSLLHIPPSCSSLHLHRARLCLGQRHRLSMLSLLRPLSQRVRSHAGVAELDPRVPHHG